MYILYNVVIMSCCGLFCSPGDIIGTTTLDFLGMKQRIMVDDYYQAHISWVGIDCVDQTNYGMLTFRMIDFGYFSFQCTPSASGHLLLDITRDANPDMQRTIITYQYNNGGGYRSWIDIDMGNCWGAFPNNPVPISDSNYLWPMVTATTNGNIAAAMAKYDEDIHRVSITTDEGNNWQVPLDFDSCATLSHFIRGSHNSPKLVFTHTRFIADTIAGGQLDNDVYYMLSTDGGMTWGPYTNVTTYQPSDSVRAYADMCACFDDNDNLHLVWSGRKIDSLGFHQASKIFHWDEVHDSITVVNSPSMYYNNPGGWWVSGDAGAWRMPADHAQLIADHYGGILYCLWNGNDDTTDVSAGGYMNGELYGSYSTDHGLIWSDYVNLTNTRSPGAGPGYCEDEDCMTANPFVVNDSIFITYIEDKDAGSYAQGEGTLTENKVYCWVLPTKLIRTGVEEYRSKEPSVLSLQVAPNPFQKELKIQYALSSRHYAEGVNGLSKRDSKVRIYDATGRLVKSITQLPNYPITWSGDDMYGAPLPAGIYFIALESGDQAATMKVIKLK